VRTTLATVLREGVTNVLRHSRAERCQVTLACRDGLLTLEIVNDGLAPAEPGGGGWGIRNLRARVAGLGGTLLAEATDEGTYRLLAQIPGTGVRGREGRGTELDDRTVRG
jgi:signal transduction histidine kinase